MALKKVQGKVEFILVKPLDEEDRYENKFRVSMKLDDGNWYSMGNSKYPNFTVKDDETDKYVELGAGSEVLVKYEENGTFRNTSRSKMTVIDLVAPAAGGGAVPSSGGGSTTFSSNASAGIQAGHAINNAVSILTGRGEDIGPANLIDVARMVHETTRKLQEEIGSGGTKAPAKKAPAKRSAPSTPSSSNDGPQYAEGPGNEDPVWNDDIPF